MDESIIIELLGSIFGLQLDIYLFKMYFYNLFLLRKNSKGNDHKSRPAISVNTFIIFSNAVFYFVLFRSE